MKIGEDGRLYAINPEAGFFGVAPGTSMHSNPNAMLSMEKNAIFTNVALTDDGDVWWEEMTKEAPEHLIDWKGRDWTPNSTEKAAHPNSRFTAPAAQCPVIDPAWEDPKGVPISAILFGGRRSDVIPLVCEAHDWEHGTFMGASVSSQMTAAAEGTVGKRRHDPFAMLPFCGYNMADYFSHWLSMSESTSREKLPKIYYVNWFRKNAEGKFMWPGFGENSRILKWVFERTIGKGQGIETAIGVLPSPESLDLSNLDINLDDLKALLEVDVQGWKEEFSAVRNYFQIFGERLPKKLLGVLDELEQKLQ